MAIPSAPLCITDYLWWALVSIIGILGWVLKRSIFGKLDELTVDVKQFIVDCHNCQAEARREFVTKHEYSQLLGVRAEAHGVINKRLGTLDNGQSRIETKLDTFHGDIAAKMKRLSETFVFRDAVISMRLDNLSDKVGVDKWTMEREKELETELKKRFESNGT